MNYLRICFVIVGVMFAATGRCAPPGIGVTVDGTPVQFARVGPQVAQGRVLVPLRGVLEQMGAFVGWDSATRSVIAQKGDRDVVLPVGSRTATVNGKPVTLDVPATIVMGTTMVPLRFLGEALGAEVKWNGATRTVEITSAGGTESPDEVDQEVKITSLSHNAKDWLTAGSTVEVAMKGTAGGSASFEIPGVAEQVKMQEVSPGSYVGTWTVPSGASSISGASMLGQLRVGANQRLIQAAIAINIDATAPVISNRLPEPDSRIADSKPSISAVVDDGTGSGIDVAAVRITVNDKNVTGQATVTKSFVSYKPQVALASGENSVEVTVSDKAGNSSSESWKFDLIEASDVIKSFAYDAPADVGPGDVITVRLEGEAGGKASFSFVTPAGQKIRTRSMTAVSPGVYESEYTVRKNDDLGGVKVVGSLTTAGGETYTVEAAETVAGAPVALAAPVITSPTDKASVGSPLIVTGTAAPNSRVRLKVDYVTTVLGALKLTGSVGEQVVDVDDQGKFGSEPINLGTLVKGKNTKYTITAVTVGASGQESEASKVEFSGS